MNMYYIFKTFKTYLLDNITQVKKSKKDLFYVEILI